MLPLIVASVTRCPDGCRVSLRCSCRVQGHYKKDTVFNDAISNPEYVVSIGWMAGNLKLDILWNEVVVTKLEVPSANCLQGLKVAAEIMGEDDALDLWIV